MPCGRPVSADPLHRSQPRTGDNALARSSLTRDTWRSTWCCPTSLHGASPRAKASARVCYQSWPAIASSTTVPDGAGSRLARFSQTARMTAWRPRLYSRTLRDGALRECLLWPHTRPMTSAAWYERSPCCSETLWMKQCQPGVFPRSAFPLRRQLWRHLASSSLQAAHTSAEP